MMFAAENLALWTYSFLLMIQTGGLFYWAGTMNRAIKEHERRLNRLENNKRGDEEHERRLDKLENKKGD
jgi:hypothetical protein